MQPLSYGNSVANLSQNQLHYDKFVELEEEEKNEAGSVEFNRQPNNSEAANQFMAYDKNSFE